MSRVTMTKAHTASGSISIPEVELTEMPQDCQAVQLRGYAHVRAVMRGADCIGWIGVEQLEPSAARTIKQRAELARLSLENR